MVSLDIKFEKMSRNEAYLEYAPAWISSLTENGIDNTSKEYANSVIDKLFNINANIFRIVKNEITIGYIGFVTKVEYNIKSCYLEFIYIKPEHRRNGFATKAIDYMQKYCMNRNINIIRLWILTNNFVSQSFFKSLGYSPKYIEYNKFISNY